ncbi:aldehyde ferredoxin oxidoreductase family protein [Spirochaetota bacterium]
MFGWTGTILRIDLTARNFKYEQIDDRLRHDFLGGRGINSRILYNEVPMDTEPLSPMNRVIFGSGPLSGTLCPSSPRCTVTAKSPLTGILGDASFGGFFAPEMKKAGIDHIIIEGKADRPVYLLIENEKVIFKDASHLRGKNTTETEQIIRDENARIKIQVASIGPAGENLVNIACLVHGYNVAGRTGMGAVLGSKNLKAICVHGNKKVPIAKPDLFNKTRETWKRKINESPFTSFFSKYGSAGPLDKEDDAGILTIKNFSQTSGFHEVEKVSAGNLHKYFTRSNSCYSCPVHCIQSFEVTDGLYKGTKGAKMPEGCNSSCGPSCGNTNAGSLFKMYNLSNEYGIDILDFGLLMSIAMDWFENGIIDTDDTDGIPLNFGNHQSMVLMLDKIARREGIGDILANGAVIAAKSIGKDAIDYVNYCKGMIFGGVDVRVLKGSALCYATATRGGDHLRGGLLIELPSKEGKPAMPPEEAVKRFGTSDVLSPKSYNKATAANYAQDMYTIADCLQVCKFVTDHNGFGIGMDDMAEMLYAVTGMEINSEKLREIASRIFTLERAFLVRQGITKDDDHLKGKWVKGPVSGGPHKGLTIEPEKWEIMLEDYYKTRGWDRETGIPSKETLDKFGLQDVAHDLQNMDKLPR